MEEYQQQVILEDEKIKAITNETNKQVHRKFPMLEHPIKEWMVKEILETLKEGKWKS